MLAQLTSQASHEYNINFRAALLGPAQTLDIDPSTLKVYNIMVV